MQGDDSAPTCFICLEECPNTLVCACKNMPCHTSCQLNLVRTRNDATCTVCLSAYTNASLDDACLCSCHVCVLVYSSALLLLTGCGLMFLSFVYSGTWYILVEAVFFVCAAVGVGRVALCMAMARKKWVVR